jgi:hypothetical protein
MQRSGERAASLDRGGVRVHLLAALAWVHLDARHDREHLIADIHAWLPKIQRGGWLSGDDYDDLKWPDVVATINETLPGARPWSTKQWRLRVE